jgi:hypothetical protein
MDISPGLTDETLAMIDTCEGEYQQLITSPRPQGPAALLAAMGAMSEEDAIAASQTPPPGVEDEPS